MSNQTWDRRGKFLFAEAIQELDELPEGPIVEIGIIRDSRPIARQSDGWATLTWIRTKRPVHCVDVSRMAIKMTRILVGGTADVYFWIEDGIKFLNRFETPIRLLYLDGPDADKNGQEAHLAMYRACRIPPDIILIDDCDEMPKRWHGRGKGELIIPTAVQDGYRIMADNRRQILLKRIQDD